MAPSPRAKGVLLEKALCCGLVSGNGTGQEAKPMEIATMPEIWRQDSRVDTGIEIDPKVDAITVETKNALSE
ncbi:MAG: hypothetical protein ACUVTR_01060 [Dehalococcoidia bacterium]